MWRSADRQMVDTTVTSRLSTMLSTMKASNDLLFGKEAVDVIIIKDSRINVMFADLHDFLIAEMDQL